MWIDKKTAAQEAGVSLQRINVLLQDGRIKAKKFSGVWMIDKSSFNVWNSQRFVAKMINGDGNEK